MSDLPPSREAVDDRFQHNLDVLAVITMGQSNAQAQELSIDMLNCIKACLDDVYWHITWEESGVSRTALVRPFWTGLIGLVWNYQNMTLRNENRSHGPIKYCSRTGIFDPFRTACFESFLNGLGQYSLEQFFCLWGCSKPCFFCHSGMALNCQSRTALKAFKAVQNLAFFAILERPWMANLERHWSPLKPFKTLPFLPFWNGLKLPIWNGLKLPIWNGLKGP